MIDSSKAFDVVPHKLLLKKNIRYWISSFQEDQKLWVNEVSAPVEITSGVSRGSVIQLFADDRVEYQEIKVEWDVNTAQDD